MGCWNHTCAVSNLHITAGQDVTVFLLVKKTDTDSASFCYGNALFDVVPMPFYGKYNDYGAVEECHGFGIPIILEYLKDRLYKFGQGPNSSHDCEVNPDLLNIDTLFDFDHENRLGIDDPSPFNHDLFDKQQLEKIRSDKGLSDSQQFELDRLAAKIKQQDSFRQVTHVVIHGDVFKAILEKWYIEEYIGNGAGNTGYGNNYRHFYYKDLISSIDEFVERRKDAAAERKKMIDELSEEDKKDPLKFNRFYRMLSQLDRADWDDPCAAVKWMSHFKSAGESSVWKLINVDECVAEYTETEDWDGLKQFTIEVLTAAWVNSFMAHTRKIWVKQSGQGSQNSEPLGYKVLAETMLDILEAERREYEDDFDDELDEEEHEIGAAE